MNTELFQSPARALYFRFASVNILVVAIIAVLVLIAEFRFNSAEVILGKYLAVHNADRAKIGRIWEQAKKSEEAKATLEQLAIDKDIVESDALNFKSFKEVAEALRQTNSIFLSRDHFIDLYLKVPESARQKLLGPNDILRLQYLTNWYRVFITHNESSVQLFFVDTDNTILNERELTKDAFANLNSYFEKVLPGALADYSNFKSQIYSRNYYFESLYRLTNESRDIFLRNAGAFLQWGDSLQNVGISDTSNDGFIEIGYEVLENGEKKIFIDRVEDFYILDLVTAFENS